jgi:hypothetical protein
MMRRRLPAASQVYLSARPKILPVAAGVADLGDPGNIPESFNIPFNSLNRFLTMT